MSSIPVDNPLAVCMVAVMFIRYLHFFIIVSYGVYYYCNIVISVVVDLLIFMTLTINIFIKLLKDVDAMEISLWSPLI